MSILVADLLQSIFERAGVPIDDSLKALLQKKELSDIVPDVVAEKVKANLISVESAREHAEVRKHLKGQFLGGFDTKVKQYAKSKLGWSDEDWREFRGNSDERSVTDYFDSFLDKVDEIGTRKGEKSGGSNIDEIRKQVQSDLNKQFGEAIEKNKATIKQYEDTISKLSEEKKQVETSWQEKFTNQERDFSLNSMMESLPFKKELVNLGMLEDAKTKIIRSITSKAVLKKDGSEWVPYNPQDSAARLLKENKPISLRELIAEEAAPFINTASGNGEPPKPPGGNSGKPNGQDQNKNPFIFGAHQNSW